MVDQPGPGAVPARLTELLVEARDSGFIGEAPLAQQVRHALGFARCVEETTEGVGGEPPEGSGRLVAAPALGFGGRWLDLGSGGGLPGLVLVLRWARASAVLLDSSARRVAFLEHASQVLEVEDRVEVVRARAEEAGGAGRWRGAFDLVVARSFGSPSVTAECGAPFLRPGALLVVSEPPSSVPPTAQGFPARPVGPDLSGLPLLPTAPDPVRWPADPLSDLGLEPGSGWRGEFGYQVLRQVRACPDRFPRRVGVAAKRPLWGSTTPAEAPGRNPHG